MNKNLSLMLLAFSFCTMKRDSHQPSPAGDALPEKTAKPEPNFFTKEEKQIEEELKKDPSFKAYVDEVKQVEGDQASGWKDFFTLVKNEKNSLMKGGLLLGFLYLARSQGPLVLRGARSFWGLEKSVERRESRNNRLLQVTKKLSEYYKKSVIALYQDPEKVISILKEKKANPDFLKFFASVELKKEQKFWTEANEQEFEKFYSQFRTHHSSGLIVLEKSFSQSDSAAVGPRKLDTLKSCFDSDTAQTLTILKQELDEGKISISEPSAAFSGLRQALWFLVLKMPVGTVIRLETDKGFKNLLRFMISTIGFYTYELLGVPRKP
jgi:hypothetical protein